MRSQYIRSLENCASEKSRRIRVLGVGNGIHTPNDPFADPVLRVHLEEGLDWSTVTLAMMLVAEMLIIYLGLSKDPGFSGGLYFDVKYLRLAIVGLMAGIAVFFCSFHYVVVAKAFENWFMRSVSALGCSAAFFVAFNVIFLLGGGTAHFQVNAVDLFCSKQYVEAKCNTAKARMELLSRSQRQILTRTSTLYGRMSQSSNAADMTIFQMIQNPDVAQREFPHVEGQ